MSYFKVDEPVDLITCFLYSIHYNDGIENLKACIESVHAALKPDGIFCFNVVDKAKINNNLFVRHTSNLEQDAFTFRSGWFYSGSGDRQALKLSIEKTTGSETQIWNDEHPMVAFTFAEIVQLLEPYFDVHLFEHDYEKLTPWDQNSGNAIITCVKKATH